MESISKKGKLFKGKFAEIAIKIGLAKPVEEEIKKTRKAKK